MVETEQQVAKKCLLIPVLLVKREPTDRHHRIVREVDQKRRLSVACGSVDYCQTVVEVVVEDVKEPLPTDRIRAAPGNQNLGDEFVGMPFHYGQDQGLSTPAVYAQL
jgi:hypothetical protein